MLNVPNAKVREVFKLLGAKEESLERMVETYQKRNAMIIPLERRIEFFNFLGFDDSWERISHIIRGDDLHQVIDFLSSQHPFDLVYKRCLEKLCHFIFAPALLEVLDEMWRKHSLHSHDCRYAWDDTLDYAQKKDPTGLLAEKLVTQAFKMKGVTSEMLEVRQKFSGNKKFHSVGFWRPLYLEERLELGQPPKQAIAAWLADQKFAQEENQRIRELEEFKKNINQLKNSVTSPMDIIELIGYVEFYEKERDLPLPETKAKVRRYFFVKLLEPFKKIIYE